MPGTAKYDPTSEQPYQAPQLPDVAPPPPMQTEATQPPVQIHGPINKFGGIAMMGDALLRGYMRGKSEREAKQVMQTKQRQDYLQYQYNDEAEKLWDLAHSPDFDPKNPSDAYKQQAAKTAMAYDDIKKFWTTQLEAGQKKPKGKKGQAQGQQQNPDQGNMGQIIAGISSNDPQAKLDAWHKMMSNPNIQAPIFYKIATLDPAEIKRQRELKAVQGEAELSKAKGTVAEEKDRTDLRELQTKQSKGPLTNEEIQQIQAIQARLGEAPKPGDTKKKVEDSLWQKKIDDPKYEYTAEEKQVLGIKPEEKLSVTSRGEVISLNQQDGTFKVLRGPQEEYEPHGRGGGSGVKPIPPATKGAWESQKDAAIENARQLYETGYKSGNEIVKLPKEEYIKRWQAAQDQYEAKFRNAGHEIEHFDVSQYFEENTDPETGKWQSGGEHLGVPKNVRSGPSGGGRKLRAYHGGKLVDAAEYTEDQVKQLQEDPEVKKAGVVFK